jgi:hypothetical protein
MKNKSIIYLALTMLFGCAAVQSGGVDKPDRPSKYVVKPGKTINGLEHRYVSPALWEKLGLGDRTILVAMEKGKSIIFVSDGLKNSKHVENSFPKDRKLINEIQLLQTHNSPDCFSYRDGEGNQKWWPKDCPK